MTLLVGEAAFYWSAIRRRDVRALAAVRRATGRRPILGVAFMGSGILFGLLAAWTGRFDFLDGWLIAAYVLVAAMFAFNATPAVQALPRLGDAAIEVEEGVRPADPLREAMAGSRTGLLVGTNVALFAAIVVDMVLKPF